MVEIVIQLKANASMLRQMMMALKRTSTLSNI